MESKESRVCEAATILREKLANMLAERLEEVGNAKFLKNLRGIYAAPEQHQGWEAIIRESDNIAANLLLVEEILRTGHLGEEGIKSLQAFKAGFDLYSPTSRTSRMIGQLLAAIGCN